MAKKEKQEKWVMNRSMHLGYIRESFSAGTVIIHYLDKDEMKIDGRMYDCTKDLIILKSNDWVAKYSKDAVEVATNEEIEKNATIQKSPESEDALKKQQNHMEVIRSDEDLMTRIIDISHTKKIKEEKSDSLEVVRGDETAEVRVARLKSEIPKMDIVKDDTLGDVGGTSLNSGAIASKTAEEHAAIREENLKKVGTVEIDDSKPDAVSEVNTDSSVTETIEESTEVIVEVKKRAGRPKGSKNKKAIENK